VDIRLPVRETGSHLVGEVHGQGRLAYPSHAADHRDHDDDAVSSAWSAISCSAASSAARPMNGSTAGGNRGGTAGGTAKKAMPPGSRGHLFQRP